MQMSVLVLMMVQLLAQVRRGREAARETSPIEKSVVQFATQQIGLIGG